MAGMIGVLALQGAFLEHLAKFAALGVPAKEVRTPAVQCGGGAARTWRPTPALF